MDDQTRAALAVPEDGLGQGAAMPLSVVADADALTERFADDMLADYRAARAAGREQVAFIVPVGPVGQFDLVAQRCNETGESLGALVVINMDEYLTPDGRALMRSPPATATSTASPNW